MSSSFVSSFSRWVSGDTLLSTADVTIPYIIVGCSDLDDWFSASSVASFRTTIYVDSREKQTLSRSSAQYSRNVLPLSRQTKAFCLWNTTQLSSPSHRTVSKNDNIWRTACTVHAQDNQWHHPTQKNYYFWEYICIWTFIHQIMVADNKKEGWKNETMPKLR